MLRTANCLLFLVFLFLIVSCKKPFKTEKEEEAYWNSAVIDTAYKKLYHDKDTTAALRIYDGVVQHSPYQTAFTKIIRHVIVANYYYFFTQNNEATASAVDAGLTELSTPALQKRYPRNYVSLLLFGGRIAYRLQHYNKANDYYFRAKKVAEASLDPCEQKEFNYCIAMVLFKQKNFRQSQDYFQKAYDLQNTCTPNTTAIGLQQQEIQSNIGLCLVELGKYDSALVHYSKALRIAEQYRDSLGAVTMDKIYGVIYGNQAQVNLEMNRLDQAERLCLKSIALNDHPGYEQENAQEVKLQLSEIYGKQHKNAAMYQELQQLRPRLDTLADPGLDQIWLRLMATYYEQTGDTRNGLSTYKSYITLRDSISRLQEKLSAADVTRQIDVKEKEMKIAILTKDNQIAFIVVCVTIGAAIMIAVILVLIYQNYKRSKNNLSVSLALNKEIQRQKTAREEEAKQRHKEITEAVIQAQENERALIGLELHDNVNQVLTTVKLHHEMVLEGMGDAGQLLPRASRYLQECINEIRSLSKRLSAPSLGKISLTESVNDLLDSVNLTSKIQIVRRIGIMKNKTLPKDLHVGIYRILQEQLNNILKHAEASEVMVELEETSCSIRLMVTDNGKGFHINGKKSGIGLKNMQTRAENLNGTFDLISAPGAGCRLVVVIPYAQPLIDNNKDDQGLLQHVQFAM